MKRLAVVLALVLAGTGCTCITKTDYQALLEASESYYASVSPVYRKATQDQGAAGALNSQSVTNRLKGDDEHREALAAARKFLEAAPVTSK